MRLPITQLMKARLWPRPVVNHRSPNDSHCELLQRQLDFALTLCLRPVRKSRYQFVRAFRSAGSPGCCYEVQLVNDDVAQYVRQNQRGN